MKIQRLLVIPLKVFGFILFLKLIFIGVKRAFLGRKIIAGDLEKAEVT